MSESLVTPLHALHLELKAKMVPFAGYHMPVQYSGIKAEHLHTRKAAGLFDVSHMGQFVLRVAGDPSINAARADGDRVAELLETFVPADIVGLPVGRQRYALLTNDQGGIIDDLMIVRRETEAFLVVNAACKHSDAAHIRSLLPDGFILDELSDRALLALQGPKAEQVMVSCFPAVAQEIKAMRFMDARMLELAGVNCHVTRSGYTGEDGFEISIPAHSADMLARGLLSDENVLPIGLGARDSLRLEAGLCLYGHDINHETTPVEAALVWSIAKSRKEDGVRAGGFPGADIILSAIREGVARKRVGILPEGKAPVREGVVLLDENKQEVGYVCSGGFGPSVNKPIAMAYVNTDNAKEGEMLFAMVRGKTLPVAVSQIPFIETKYKR